MHDSRKKREGKGKERKTWRKGKALPYRRKLTNNVEWTMKLENHHLANTRKTTKWSGGRQLSRKRIQNNDSKDDPGPQKNNGGKDREDARNV